MMDVNTKSHLKTEEVAEYFGVSVAAVLKWRGQGRGPKWVRLGRCVRYPIDAVLAWAESQPGGGGR